jgi:hypothetical protein
VRSHGPETTRHGNCAMHSLSLCTISSGSGTPAAGSSKSWPRVTSVRSNEPVGESGRPPAIQPTCHHLLLLLHLHPLPRVPGWNDGAPLCVCVRARTFRRNEKTRRAANRCGRNREMRYLTSACAKLNSSLMRLVVFFFPHRGESQEERVYRKLSRVSLHGQEFL